MMNTIKKLQTHITKMILTFTLSLVPPYIDAKEINICKCMLSPEIDGKIEETWQKADSIYDFIQYMPYENEEVTERTVVYFMQDANNFYVAFRCSTKTSEPQRRLIGGEDWVCLYLDTFNNKTTAYFFKVTASGLKEDGIILDDGRQFDFSWEGVWYSVVKCFDNRYEVEIKIPFKSIRYDKNTSTWGINFRRFIPTNQETDYWVIPSQRDGLRVSKFGTLKGINPQTKGYYLEFYPEGILRYEEYYGEDREYRANAGFNLKWDMTSQTTLNAVINPDFAQIEADPYTLNLSYYPVYLIEKRPFFIEGSEIFKVSGFDEGSAFYRPLNIFYSRKIGQTSNDRPIPILGGFKFITKSRTWQFGILSTLTNSFETEPKKAYSVFRVKRGIFRNSNVGILLSGAAANKADYNYGIGCDLAYRFGADQLLFQSALSNRNGKRGMAMSSGFRGYFGNFLTKLSSQLISDSFDVGDIGYVPWSGRNSIIIEGGPFKQFTTGFIQNLYVSSGINIIKEPSVVDWSKLLNLGFACYLRNNWALTLKTKYGSYYEVDTGYIYRDIDFWIWGTDSKTYDISFELRYNYSYNYLRNWLGYQYSNYLWFSYYFLSRFCAAVEANVWVEWDATNTISAMTPTATPRIECRITKDMNLGIFNEFVFEIPNTNFDKTALMSKRIGLLFSWNFLPKSWLYIAFNDYRAQNESGSLQLQNRIGAIKMKYLIYF